MKQRRPGLLLPIMLALVGHGIAWALVSRVLGGKRAIALESHSDVEVVFEIDETLHLNPPPKTQVEPETKPQKIFDPPPPPMPKGIKGRRIHPTIKRSSTPETDVQALATTSENPMPEPEWAREPMTQDPIDAPLPGGHVFDLASLSPSGLVPVAVATSPSAGLIGGGVGGKNTQARGPSGSGEGFSHSTAVSIATIKKRPVPIGDTDFVDARKKYPESAKRSGIEGTIKVRLVVDIHGAVASQSLITKLGHGLDQLALSLAKKLRFEPALDSLNRPVPAAVIWTFNFTLPRASAQSR